eukprot:359404-Chlamydomonas_euryale.AAC.2
MEAVPCPSCPFERNGVPLLPIFPRASSPRKRRGTQHTCGMWHALQVVQRASENAAEGNRSLSTSTFKRLDEHSAAIQRLTLVSPCMGVGRREEWNGHQRRRGRRVEEGEKSGTGAGGGGGGGGGRGRGSAVAVFHWQPCAVHASAQVPCPVPRMRACACTTRCTLARMRPSLHSSLHARALCVARLYSPALRCAACASHAHAHVLTWSPRTCALCSACLHARPLRAVPVCPPDLRHKPTHPTCRPSALSSRTNIERPSDRLPTRPPTHVRPTHLQAISTNIEDRPTSAAVRNMIESAVSVRADAAAASLVPLWDSIKALQSGLKDAQSEAAAAARDAAATARERVSGATSGGMGLWAPLSRRGGVGRAM